MSFSSVGMQKDGIRFHTGHHAGAWKVQIGRWRQSDSQSHTGHHAGAWKVQIVSIDVIPQIQHPCGLIRETLRQGGLYDNPSRTAPPPGSERGEPASSFRIASTPFPVTPHEVHFLEGLGTHLLKFYRGVNRLYQDSVKGREPDWVAAYLDQGKPESLVAYSRMNRFRDSIPGVIRPDILQTDTGPIITELDSVPGGIGLTAALAHAYGGQEEGRWQVTGGADGMVHGFASMLKSHKGDRAGCIAIVVSEEAKDYRAEMQWMAEQLRNTGLETFCVEPRHIQFTEEALWLVQEKDTRPIAVVYRFFELFDLKNVPKAELMLYAAKKNLVTMTPPVKPAVEEKMTFALFHHPALEPFWREELGEETYAALFALLPRTWILDPRPISPSALIPHFRLAGRPIRDWRVVAEASQKDRRLVVKPSGFSELAWGSRGVAIGHDLSQHEWAGVVEHAVDSFLTTPYIIQEFHKGRQVRLSYVDDESADLVPMAGRARVSPYYFVQGEKAVLGGVLATVCPVDKKLIHGMRDAIMAPGAIGPQARQV